MYWERIWLFLALALTMPRALAAQIAILQIHVIEGEGAVHVPGSRSARPLTVEITDETGKPVADAAVSFHVPDEGPGGSFLNGLRTTVATTDARGRASVRGLQVNRNPGRFQIRIFASKEQARAGTVSFQYIAGTGSGAAPTPLPVVRGAIPVPPAQPATQPARRGGGGKWIVLAVLLGGGAAAGVMAAGRSSPMPTSVIVPPPPVLSIGMPSVTIGKP